MQFTRLTCQLYIRRLQSSFTTKTNCMHGCFNHRVVTLVADKLNTQWLRIIYFADCVKQPERKQLVTTEHL